MLWIVFSKEVEIASFYHASPQEASGVVCKKRICHITQKFSWNLLLQQIT